MCLEAVGTGPSGPSVPSGHEAAIAVIFRPHRPSVVAVGADALVAKTWSDIIVEWTHQREGSLIQFFSGLKIEILRVALEWSHIHKMPPVTDYRSPFAGILTWLLSVGYDLRSSILELTDNSLSKISSNLRVILFKEAKLLSRVIVVDDGTGMSLQTLCESFIIANVKAERDSEDIGKFGIGMKSAIMNMGRQIIILSRVVGGNIVGLYADVDQMKENNSPSPTEVCENVTGEWAVKYISQDSWEKFSSQSSGTLIQVKNLRQKCQMVYERAKDILMSMISTSYSLMPNQCLLQIEDTDKPSDSSERFLTIVPNDLFYHGKRECLDEDAHETVLHIFSGEPGHPNRVIEENTSKRRITGNKFTSGKSDKPAYYEYMALEKNKGYHTNMKEIDRLPTSSSVLGLSNTTLLGSIKLRTIQVSETQFKNEAELFSDGDQLHGDRKGIWFNRGIRTVGFAKKIGRKIHDRTTMAAERQRMLVTFPAALDDEVGSKFNKQMEDKELPSQILTDAIYSIYRQVTNPWVDSDKARMEKKKEEEEKERLRLELEDRKRWEEEQRIRLEQQRLAAEEERVRKAEELRIKQEAEEEAKRALDEAIGDNDGGQEEVDGQGEEEADSQETDSQETDSQETDEHAQGQLDAQDASQAQEQTDAEEKAQVVVDDSQEQEEDVGKQDTPSNSSTSPSNDVEGVFKLTLQLVGDNVCVSGDGGLNLEIPSFGKGKALMDWLSAATPEYIHRLFA